MDRLYSIGSPAEPRPDTRPGLAAFVRSDESASTRLVDSFGRRLTYLRVSVTDRCNLRCTYCLPEDALLPNADREFLSAAEIERLVAAFVHLGIRRVRLTGGEPLVRRDIVEIARRIKAIPGVENLALSTNGTELERLAPALARAGVDRVNVSVDSLDPETFRALTERGDLERVWHGIEAALEAGLAPVKLNTVLLPTSRGEDFDRLAALTLERPLSVRFIEMMPTASNRHLQTGATLTCDAVRARIEERFGALEPAVATAPRTGPATAYRLAGARGEIGFITPLSHTFCADCNRLRLTARGELRLCLFAERNIPLRPHLDEPDAEHRLEAAILGALAEKPAEHMLRAGQSGNLTSFMEIGG